MSIQKRMQNLPVKPEELEKWILIGKIKLKAQIAAIKAIDKIEEGIAAKEAALSDTQDLAEELLYAEARLGEILATIPKPKFNKNINGSLRGTTETLPTGIDKKQSHIAQELHRHEETIAEVVAMAREKGEVPVRQHVLNKIKGSLVGAFTGNAENYTPKYIIDKAKTVMGNIDLDPASCEYAQSIVEADKYYTQKTNGLIRKWYGNIFLNPPYGMPLIREFTDKLIAELPNIKQAILLTNDQTDTNWWQKCVKKSSCVCFVNKRIKFYTPDCGLTSPTNGQTFMYFGKDRSDFIENFQDIGLIMEIVK